MKAGHPGREGSLTLRRLKAQGAWQVQEGGPQQRFRHRVRGFQHVGQQHLGGAPNRLLGQGQAAGDVVGVAGVGKLGPEGVVDGVIGRGQVGKHHADPCRAILDEGLPRPLGGGTYLISLALKPHAAFRKGRAFGRRMLVDPATGAFHASQKVRGLGLDPLEPQQVQVTGLRGGRIRQPRPR